MRTRAYVGFYFGGVASSCKDTPTIISKGCSRNIAGEGKEIMNIFGKKTQFLASRLKIV